MILNGPTPPVQVRLMVANVLPQGMVTTGCAKTRLHGLQTTVVEILPTQLRLSMTDTVKVPAERLDTEGVFAPLLH